MACDTNDCCGDPSLQLPSAGSTGTSSGTVICQPGPPGGQGAAGAAGADGADGSSAYTLTAGEMNIPDGTGVDTITLAEPAGWVVIGMVISIEGAGYMLVTNIDGTSLTYQNLAYPGNASPGTSIDAGAVVTPAAPRGADAPSHQLGYILLQKRVSYTTDNGPFNAPSGPDVYRPRLLNTVAVDTRDCVVALDNATGIFTLKGGNTYEIHATAPAYSVNRHRARLRNVDTSDVFNGTSEFSTAAGGQTSSDVVARVDIAFDTQFILEHRCQTTKTVDGMGRAANFNDGVPYQVFEQVEIWQVNS